MEKTDIEFLNGLAKGILACHTVLQESSTLEEAREKITELRRKSARKMNKTVDLALK